MSKLAHSTTAKNKQTTNLNWIRKFCRCIGRWINIEHKKKTTTQTESASTEQHIRTIATKQKNMPKKPSSFDDHQQRCHRWYIPFMDLRYSSLYFGAANGYCTCLQLAMGKLHTPLSIIIIQKDQNQIWFQSGSSQSMEIIPRRAIEQSLNFENKAPASRFSWFMLFVF